MSKPIPLIMKNSMKKCPTYCPILDYKDKKFIEAALTGDGVVRALENKFQEFLEDRFHCLSVMNATSGLAAVLRCLPRGKVIAPLFTSPATWAAIHHADHELEFCDIHPTSVCLSAEDVARCVSRSVRAIVTVNIFGHQSHLQELRAVADRVEALLIVDAAQSLATALENPERISLSDAVVFSLGPSKWLSCADGGMLAIKSHELWEKLVQGTQHPMRQVLDVPHISPNLCCYNYRINPYTASQALEMLQDIDVRTAKARLRQEGLIHELTSSRAIEQLPASVDTIFEPLTVMPRSTKRPIGPFFDLPIPSQVILAEKLNLPETSRQFRNRKRIFIPENNLTWITNEASI